MHLVKSQSKNRFLNIIILIRDKIPIKLLYLINDF